MTIPVKFFDLSGMSSDNSRDRYVGLIKEIKKSLSHSLISPLIVKTVYMYIPGKPVSKVTLSGKVDIFDETDVKEYLRKGAIILHIDGDIYYTGKRYYFKIGHDMFPGSIYVGAIALRERTNADGSLESREQLVNELSTIFEKTFGDLIDR